MVATSCAEEAFTTYTITINSKAIENNDGEYAATGRQPRIGVGTPNPFVLSEGP